MTVWRYLEGWTGAQYDASTMSRQDFADALAAVGWTNPRFIQPPQFADNPWDPSGTSFLMSGPYPLGLVTISDGTALVWRDGPSDLQLIYPGEGSDWIADD